MSPRGRLALASLLALALIGGVSSVASAQSGNDWPNRAVLAPPVAPTVAASPSNFSSYMRLDQALQFNVSLAAYRWLEPSTSRMEARTTRSAMSARQSARSAWLWKRY